MAINVLFFNGLLINWRGNRKSAHLKLLWLTAVHRNVALVLELKFIYSEKTTKFCEISPIYRFDHYYIGQIFSGDFASASCTSHTLFVQSSEHYYSALCTESKLTSQYFLIYDFFFRIIWLPLLSSTPYPKPKTPQPKSTIDRPRCGNKDGWNVSEYNSEGQQKLAAVRGGGNSTSPNWISKNFQLPHPLICHTQNLKPHNQSPQLTAQDVVIKMAEMWVNITAKSSRS